MADEVFVDGILGVGLSQGALRVDFFTVSDVSKASRETKLRLIMTTEGFVTIYAHLTQVMEQLKKAGGAPRPADAAPQAQAPADKITPNF